MEHRHYFSLVVQLARQKGQRNFGGSARFAASQGKGGWNPGANKQRQRLLEIGSHVVFRRATSDGGGQIAETCNQLSCGTRLQGCGPHPYQFV